MREPWDIIDRFVTGQQRSAAIREQTGDQMLLDQFRSGVSRADARTQQGFALDQIGVRNTNAVNADTVAYERQLARDRTAYEQQAAAAAASRANELADAGTADERARNLAILNAQLDVDKTAIKEANERGGMRRYGGAPTGDPIDNYIDATFMRESGGRGDAKNPLSSARGYGQFIDSTWNTLVAQSGGALRPDGRGDPTQERLAMRMFTSQNAEHLQRAGIPISDGNLYAAHFLGAGGAAAALKAPDNVMMRDVVHPGVIQANNFLAGMTVGDFKQWTASKYMGGDGQRRYAEGSNDGGVSGTILRNPVANSAGAERGGEIILPPGYAEAMAADPRYSSKEPTGDIVRYNQAALELLPKSLRENLVPMPRSDGDKESGISFLQLRDRQHADNPNGPPLQADKSTRQTTAENVTPSTPRKRTIIVDGKPQYVE